MANGKVIPAKKCILVGIGMGNWDMLTVAAYRHLEEAPLLIGAKRVLDCMPDTVHGLWKQSFIPEEIFSMLENWQFSIEAQNATFPPCVVYSGDTGFYSGCKTLLPLLESNGYEVEVIPGITSSQYLSSKIHRSWQNWWLESAHGTDIDVVSVLYKASQKSLDRKYTDVFFLTGGKITAATIIDNIVEAGLGHLNIIVGENLSYKNERIVSSPAYKLRGLPFSELSVVLVDISSLEYINVDNNIQNREVDEKKILLPGLKDESFIRSGENEKLIPMTKQEVRSIILSKLELSKGEIVYDIGSGTGSITVEIALCASCKVFSIECDKDAYELTKRNVSKFKLDKSVTTVLGAAPDALALLPVPDVVFIGGSKGKLKTIVKSVRSKNPSCRILVSAVTMETLAEALSLSDNCEVTQLSVSKTNKAGKYNLLKAQNPVFLIKL